MNVTYITDIIFVAMFCFYLIGSVVYLILAYIKTKKLLDELRYLVRLKEHEIFGGSGEVNE